MGFFGSFKELQYEAVIVIPTTRPMPDLCIMYYYSRIHEKSRSGNVNSRIRMSMKQKTFAFDDTIDMCCRILKREKVIKSHEFDPIGGFKKVEFPSGRKASIKCADDLWKLVPNEDLKDKILEKDKKGILRNNGLQYFA